MKDSTIVKPVHNPLVEATTRNGTGGTTSEQITVRVHPRTYYEYHFDVNGDIGEPEQFSDLLYVLRTAEETDEVHIHLNTPGGLIHTTVQIINAMRSCNAKVVTCIEGINHSCGTLIFLSGHELRIQPNTLMLFHNYSGVAWGKGNELRSHAEATEKWIRKLMNDTYKGFLTKKELKKLEKDQDFWLGTEDVLKRLPKFAESKQGKENAAVQALMEGLVGSLEQE